MTNDDLTKEVGVAVYAAVKPVGFRKTGQTFTRDLGHAVQIVNLQKSTSSDQGHIKITVNLGLWIKALAPIRAGVPDRGNIWTAHWRKRIGNLLPGNPDAWWEAKSSNEARAAGVELARLVVDEAIPALELVSAPGALVALWKSGSSPGLTDTERERYLRKLQAGAA